MSSMEIERICNKRHDNVMRDIQVTLDQAGIAALKFESGYLDANNQRRPCYFLPKRECLILVSGYSVPLRTAIIDRWQELAAKLAAAGGHYVPKSHAEALIMAGELALKNEGRPKSMCSNLSAPATSGNETSCGTSALRWIRQESANPNLGRPI